MTPKPYRLTVGDEIAIHSASKPFEINSERVWINLTAPSPVRLLGQVQAAVKNLRRITRPFDRGYQRFFDSPQITIIPLKINTRVQGPDRCRGSALWRRGRARRGWRSWRRTNIRASPRSVRSLPAQGSEHRRTGSGDQRRHQDKQGGVLVNAVLVQRAHRYVYVMGEVGQPGRFPNWSLPPRSARPSVSAATGKMGRISGTSSSSGATRTGKRSAA